MLWSFGSEPPAFIIDVDRRRNDESDASARINTKNKLEPSDMKHMMLRSELGQIFSRLLHHRRRAAAVEQLNR
jgi:hypothetical protein